MSSSPEPTHVTLRHGDLLASDAQTLVNTVNCVGVMGRGIALAFKRRYPDMFQDYVRRCELREVHLGRPYLYRADDHLIVNFPTKFHWRAVSRLADIVAGLEHLESRYREWGITSLAVPPLGCGNGQLDWEVVGPTLYRHLARLDVPVQLYVPRDAPLDPELLAGGSGGRGQQHNGTGVVDPAWVAVAAVLDRLERQRYHWPVGRVLFQKLVYFATKAGIPTGLHYEKGSYGPYADGVKRMIARLQDNGLLVERQLGRMFEVRVGPAYRETVAGLRERMEPWRPIVTRTVDLMTRMDSHTAEVAASVHFEAERLTASHGRRPTAYEVLGAVAEWKIRRKPAVTRESIIEGLVLLALCRWIEVELDEDLEPVVDGLVVA